jgi:hypothetical protein
MKLKKQIRLEKLRTRNAVAMVRVQLNRVLQEEHNRQLFRMSEKDSYRLLMLRNWTQKYKVTLSYIVGVLLDHYGTWAKKYRSGKSKGLGIRIPTLCGQHSEAYLKERIRKDFPENENIAAWQFEKRARIFQHRLGDEPVPKGKPMLSYPTVKTYIRKYGRRVDEARNEYSSFTQDPKNKRRRYRGNPFC